MRTRDLMISLVACAAIAACFGCSEDSTSPEDDSPDISAVLPPGAGAGTEITIRGSNFGDGQGTGSVQVAGADAAVDSWSDAEILCTLPAGIPEGAGAAVKVTTGAGRSASAQIEITPPNICRITTGGAMDHYPCWSGDGEWIYFSSTGSGGANWDIYRVPSIGGKVERLTFDEGADFYPDMRPSTGELAWSSQMVLVSNTERDYEIFAGYPVCIGPGGGCSISMLTNNESRDLDPAWALTVHMGYSMAHTYEEVDQGGFFLGWKVVLTSGTGRVELTGGRQPNFSPDGQWVVYTHQDNIYKIPTGGGAAVQLTGAGSDWYPHWGSTNDRIVFQRMNGGQFEDIFVMNSDGSDLEPLVSTRSNEYCPSWSPDCAKVVYYALVGGSFDIYVRVVP